MHTELEEDVKKEASVPGLTSPAEFALAELFREVRGADFHKPILEAAAALRRHGELLLPPSPVLSSVLFITCSRV